ncbi:inducible alternative oxidase 2, partial [Linderina pennispora]
MLYTLSTIKHSPATASLAYGIQRRAFGIKTTLRVQEYISKALKSEHQNKTRASSTSATAGAVENTAKDTAPVKLAKKAMEKKPEPRTAMVFSAMPDELRVPVDPKPMRPEIMDHKWNSNELESLDVGTTKHRIPDLISDKMALWFVKNARKPTDIFFRNKYLHRSVMLEVVAAVPGM